MTPFRIHFRLIWPTLLVCGVLVAVCAVMAASLYREQGAVSVVMRNNIDSIRAAADLEQTLLDEISILEEHVEQVDPLNAKLNQLALEIAKFADDGEQQTLTASLVESLKRYQHIWSHLPPASSPEHGPAVRKAIDHLKTVTLPRCQALRQYNRSRLDDSAREHEQLLRELAWGMVAVGGTGGVAGLVLGYGVAAGVRRSIQRLQVGVRGAAGKLGRPGSEIVLTGEGEFGQLEDQIQSLADEVGRVVDKLQQRDREVLRAEQLAAVGQLAAGVAHEIRNPLTAIKMLVQMAQTDSSDAKLPPEDLAVIEHEVRRMERSLQTFLDFARPPKPQRVPIDLAKVVKQSLDLVRGRSERQRVEVQFDHPEGPVQLTVDPEQLRQVIVNLLLNALDVMPSGGTLVAKLQSRPAGGAELSISDTGPGIPAAIQPRLFQPFVSGKDTGLGLGLVICRRIAEDHGGTVDGYNRPEGGACFTLTLPGESGA